MVKTLARKRWRDLWRLRGQAGAVALVAAIGVANLVMSRATLDSLQSSRDRYYRQYGFADVFVDLKRAPSRVADALESIPGVARVDTRVVAWGRAQVPGFGEPVRIHAVSAPLADAGALNRLHLRSGRLPARGELRVLVVSDAFADAHALREGVSLPLLINGHRQVFRIVGIGATPEFVAQISPQSLFPDARTFAIVWLPRATLEGMLGMRGAFNSAAIAVHDQARLPAVLDAVDARLARFGGTGAIARGDQRSHRYLHEELRQLRTMARLFPAVFLGVSAFVLYVVLGRLVTLQREQIGTLKAFGYTDNEVWRHYAGLALLIGLAGAAMGIALGAGLGEGLADLYRQFYRLPFLDFQLRPMVLVTALLVSVGSALLGASLPIVRAARLAPAEAMRARTPSRIRPRGPWRAGTWLDPAHRLIGRSLVERPLRTVLTCIGLALGTGVMLVGRFQEDAIRYLIDHQFERADRYDLYVTLGEPVSQSALAEAASLGGVLRTEAQRAVPVQLRFRSAVHRTVLVGLTGDARLRRPLDPAGDPLDLPLRGVTLTRYLAQVLDVDPGEVIELEVLVERRRILHMPVARLVDEPFGAQAYLPMDALHDALGDGRRVDALALRVDAARLPRLLAELDRRPAVAGIVQRLESIRNFYASLGRTLLTFTVVATSFGVVITAGVVYSATRVALSERLRELASLRVLGFTPHEVGYLLLGELSLLVVCALPIGFALGHALIALLLLGYDSELVRVPHHVSAATYGMAGTVALASAAGSALALWRQVLRLDLVGVLKARD